MVHKIPDSVNSTLKSLRNNYLGLFLCLFGGVGCAAVSVGQTAPGESYSAIVLTMAQSLEKNGSPVPYLQSVQSKLKKAGGRTDSSLAFNEERVQGIVLNWEKLEKPLQLDELSRESGKNIRHAIQGHWKMSVGELVEHEAGLTANEKNVYKQLLEKKKLGNSDTEFVDSFYETVFDKLTRQGKGQVIRRLDSSMRKPVDRVETDEELGRGTYAKEILRQFEQRVVQGIGRESRPDDLKAVLIKEFKLNEDSPPMNVNWWWSDALDFSHRIKGDVEKRVSHIEKRTNKQQAEQVKAAMLEMAELLLLATVVDLELSVRD